jgi:hypothetical protein
MIVNTRIARIVMLRKIAAAEIERVSAGRVIVAVTVGAVAELVVVVVARMRIFCVSEGIAVAAGEDVDEATALAVEEAEPKADNMYGGRDDHPSIVIGLVVVIVNVVVPVVLGSISVYLKVLVGILPV